MVLPDEKVSSYLGVGERSDLIPKGYPVSWIVSATLSLEGT